MHGGAFELVPDEWSPGVAVTGDKGVAPQARSQRLDLPFFGGPVSSPHGPPPCTGRTTAMRC
jgi:hypothetical protein